MEFLDEVHDPILDGEFAGGYHVHQEAYTRTIPVMHVPIMSSSREDDGLRGRELEDYDSSLGSMNWLSGHTRPDSASTVSLAKRDGPKLKDLRAAMKEVERLHRTAAVGLLIVPVPLDDCIVVSFADSSWANAEGLKTQTGRLLLLAPRSVLATNAAASIVDHKSKRTPRVVRSTLAGEANATDSGVDAAWFFASFLSEILTAEPATKSKPCLDIYPVTDCKSLYDAVHQMTPSLLEKRTAIDIYSIRENTLVKNFRWCPTDRMLADALTKADEALKETLMRFMMYPVLSLVDTTWSSELRGGEGDRTTS